MSESLAAWEAAAPGWERQRDRVWAASRVVGERLVDVLDPQAGQVVLELACGAGDTGLAAAARVGESGKLIATDFSPRMVAAARRRAEERGVRNVEFRVLDAQSLDLGDASVDGVLCRWGYMLMPEPERAFAETRRVLRPGGRLAFSVWSGGDDNPWASVIGRTMVDLGVVPPPQPGEPGIFALANPERIRELVAGAGFDEPVLERVDMAWDYGSFDGWWAFTMELAGALSSTISKLHPQEQRRVRAAVGQRAKRFAPDYVVPGVCWNVFAT